MKKKLKDVCIFYSGTGFPIKYQGDSYGDLPFYKVGDIANNAMIGNSFLDTCKNYISYDIAKKIKGTIVPKNVIVFAKIGEALKLNRRCITSSNCLIDNNVTGIGCNEKYLDLKYFYFFMKNLKMEKLAESTTVPSVRKTKLEEVFIEVPAMKLQLDISKILGILQDIILHRQNQLVHMDNLVKARFVEMFGDPEINPYGYKKAHMGDYITLLTDFSSNGSYETLDNGVTMYDKPNYAWIVRTTDLETGDMTSIKYIDESAYELLEKSKLFGGEIIMNKIGSAGNVYLMPEINMPASLGRNAFMFRYDDRINPKYLFQLLKSEYGQREIKQYVRGAVTKTITKNDVKAVTIVVPPIEIQNKYVDFIIQVNKSKLLAASQPQIHIYKTLTLL